MCQAGICEHEISCGAWIRVYVSETYSLIWQSISPFEEDGVRSSSAEVLWWTTKQSKSGDAKLSWFSVNTAAKKSWKWNFHSWSKQNQASEGEKGLKLAWSQKLMTALHDFWLKRNTFSTSTLSSVFLNFLFSSSQWWWIVLLDFASLTLTEASCHIWIWSSSLTLVGWAQTSVPHTLPCCVGWMVGRWTVGPVWPPGCFGSEFDELHVCALLHLTFFSASLTHTIKTK